MALRKLGRRNYGGKSPVSIKYQNLHTFKEELILLCQTILETRRITHSNSSAHFTIPSKEISINCNFHYVATLRMISQILKSVHFTKTQKSRYLENETFFLQIKKFIK